MKNSSARLAILGVAAVGASLVVADLLDESSPATDSFNWRLYDYYMSSRISTEADIVEEYQWEQRRFMPLLFPDPKHVLVQKGGILPVADWTTFSKDFVEGLVPVERDGITYWPIWVVEDPQAKPRRRLLMNAEEKIIGALDVPKEYDSAWYVKECYPHLYDGVTTPAESAFLAKMEAIYDGKRLIMSYDLIDQDNLIKLVLQRSLENPVLLEGEGDGSVMMMMGEGGDDLEFVEIAPSGTGGAMSVTVAYPETFTDRISIIACEDLVAQDWSLLTTINPPAELNTVTYVDEDAANYSSRFYHAFNADYDGDGDGISDGQEHFLGGTDPDDPDNPPNVKGTVSHETFSEAQAGVIRVVAVTSAGSWSTEYSDLLDGPGAYHIVNIPAGDYYIKAFRDPDASGLPATYEPQGSFVGSPLTVNGQVTGVDIGLVTLDDDEDDLPDWWEMLHFGNLNQPATGDVEPDVLDNLAEYQAGTDPNNADEGYIPNDKNGQEWPPDIPIGSGDGAPAREREYKFHFSGIDSIRLNDGVARALGERIDNVLKAAVGDRSQWAVYAALKPSLLFLVHGYFDPANANYARREPNRPTHTCYMDIYFDTDNDLCYSYDNEYRLRRRTDNTERWFNWISDGPVPPAEKANNVDNNRCEFMSKVARSFDPELPGWSEVTESRRAGWIPWFAAKDIQDRINDFQDGRWPEDLLHEDPLVDPASWVVSDQAEKVGNPAWVLRTNLVHIAAEVSETDILKFRPKLVLVQERRRQHLKLDQLLLGNGEVFIITVDASFVYDQGEMLNFMKNPTTAPLPQPMGSFVEVEVEFEHNTSEGLDILLANQELEQVHEDLEALKQAFLHDQTILINLIMAEFNDKPHDLTEFYSIKGAAMDLSTHAQVAGSGLQREGVTGIAGEALAFDGNGYVSYVCQEPSFVEVDPDSQFLLTEVIADKDMTTLKDEDNESEDWVEIRNVSDNALSLNGWYLTDNLGNLQKWALPDVTVPLGGFVIVFADNDRPGDTDPPLHAPFGIDAGDDPVALVNGTSIATSYSIPSIPRYGVDISYGIAWNGTDWIEGSFNASPGGANEGHSLAPSVVTVDPASPFLLTEVMADGGLIDDALEDEAGDKESWIEIRNVSGSQQSLNGWYLTDDLGSLQKWAFPDITVPAGDFVIVFGDGTGATEPLLHAGFEILVADKPLALVNGTSIATRYDIPSIPQFAYDVSCGIAWNGTEWVEGFFNASPGEPNEGIYRRGGMELGNADFTISLWVKTSTAGVALLSKSNTDGALTTGEKQLYLDGSGKVRYFGQGAGTIAGSTAINDGDWHHVVITLDVTSGNKKVYVDGQDDTDSMATDYDESVTEAKDAYRSNLLLGYDTSSQATGNMIGVLDEVAIWARTLSASDIADIHTAGRQGAGVDTRAQLPAGLQFHASMDVFLAPQTDSKYQQAYNIIHSQ